MEEVKDGSNPKAYPEKTTSLLRSSTVYPSGCLVFCLKASSLCLVYSRHESYLLNINKAREHLYGGAPDSFQAENSYTVGISHAEVRVLTTELRRLYIQVKTIFLTTFQKTNTWVA